MAKYSDKYKDPRWQKKRLKILERDNWACQICFDTEETLHVHHRFYTPGKDIWDYPDAALVTLCEPCHSNETDEKREYDPLILEVLHRVFWSDDLRELAYGFRTLALHGKSDEVAAAIAWFLSNSDKQRGLLDQYQEWRHKQHLAYMKRREAEGCQGSDQQNNGTQATGTGQ